MLNYIIVQAGGLGSRMERLTRNKPKALVPVYNLPIIFHLFRKFPDKKFIVIADYKSDVMERYLREFAEVDYSLVDSSGDKGTCSGLQAALSYIPEKQRFMLIWCDLVLPDDYEIPETDANIVGISKDFPCRWKYESGVFSEEKSAEQGVAGLFIFNEKSVIADVPREGEFVKWLKSASITFQEQPLYRTHEYGTLSEYEKISEQKTRPFNRIEIEGDKLYKIPVDKQGRDLAVREKAWYQHLKGIHFENIPKIYSYSPLCMELIEGKCIYEYPDLPLNEKREILRKIINCLKQVHQLESVASDEESYRIAYLDKTYQRLEKVKNLVPFAQDPLVTVNGRKCRNIFYHQDVVERMVMRYLPAEFTLIHGDCTFSNTMLKDMTTPILIDPRGYFGTTELYGDPAYDWVKLYYSLVSNYDQFNLKRFDLYINDNSINSDSTNDDPISDGSSDLVISRDDADDIVVSAQSVFVDVASNGWEALEQDFFDLLGDEVSPIQMKIFLALIWLSLTTYAWQDYDSICGAFYLGLYYLEDALSSEEKRKGTTDEVK